MSRLLNVHYFTPLFSLFFLPSHASWDLLLAVTCHLFFCHLISSLFILLFSVGCNLCLSSHDTATKGLYSLLHFPLIITFFSLLLFHLLPLFCPNVFPGRFCPHFFVFFFSALDILLSCPPSFPDLSRSCFFLFHLSSSHFLPVYYSSTWSTSSFLSSSPPLLSPVIPCFDLSVILL